MKIEELVQRCLVTVAFRVDSSSDHSSCGSSRDAPVKMRYLCCVLESVDCNLAMGHYFVVESSGNGLVSSARRALATSIVALQPLPPRQGQAPCHVHQYG